MADKTAPLQGIDTSHRGIAKTALGIKWKNTETAARRVAEYAADLVQGVEAERYNLRIEAKGYAGSLFGGIWFGGISLWEFFGGQL